MEKSVKNAPVFLHGFKFELNKRRDVVFESHPLVYKNGTYELLKIRSAKIGSDDLVMLITSGFHGNEIFGPYALLKNIHEFISYAHQKGIKLIIYPLINPSGFEAGKRYNIDSEDDLGPPNNDFVLYKLNDGTIIDDLGNGKDFAKWFWSSDDNFKRVLPVETALMHRLLRSDPLPQIVAALDLHADAITNSVPAAYHYTFGSAEFYLPIVNEIKKMARILSYNDISAGQACASKSDKDGFIMRHDGTLSDLMHRLGAKFSVTSEVMSNTSLEVGEEIQALWIFGLIDLAAGETVRKGGVP